MDYLEDARKRMAEFAFADYDFGDTVRGSGSWGHVEGDTLWSMPVYFKCEGQHPIRRIFKVRFVSGTQEVEDCYLE